MGCAARKDKTSNSASSSDEDDNEPKQNAAGNGNNARRGTMIFEEAHAKLVVIGDKGCGKTSLLHRTVTGSFEGASATDETTIAVDVGKNLIATRTTITDPSTWNKMSRALLCEYFVGDHVLQRDNGVVRTFRGLFLVFAVDNRESFEKLKNFKMSLIQHYTFYVEITKYLIGLKVDAPERAVSLEDAQHFVKTKNEEDIIQFKCLDNDFVSWQYLELSALDGTGIDGFKKELIKIVSEF